MSIFRNDDYVITVKKPRRCKQSILPKEKKDKYYNGSKSYNVDIPRDFKHFKKASELK